MKTVTVLKAISQSADLFFKEKNFGKAVKKSLRLLGEAAEVCRVYLFENHPDEHGELCASQRYEWTAPAITPQISNPELQNFRWSMIPSIRDHVRKRPFHSLVKNLPPSFRKMLQAQDIVSLIMVPVYVHRKWYGFIGFDDCETERAWTRGEIETLQIAARILGGAIEQRRHEAHLRSILEGGIDSLDTGLFILDSGFTVVWMNRTMEEFFGVSRGRVIGRDKRDFIRQRIHEIIIDHEAFKKKLLSAYGDNRDIEEFTCEVRAGGRRRRRILRHWSRPIRQGLLAGGRIEHYTDITAVERATAALKVSEKKYHDLVENMSEGLVHVDEDTILRYVNESCCRMLGYRRNEVLNKRIGTFLDSSGKKLVEEARRQLKEGQYLRHEVMVRSKKGEMVPVEVSLAPVFDEEGKYRGGTGVFIDIRERKKLERMKDELLRDASHELKAPTAKIVMGLELIKRYHEGPMNEDERLGIRMIESETERIRANIDSLMDLSAFESGRVNLHRETFDLRILLEEVSAEFKESAREKRVTILCKSGKAPLPLRADRERIYHLFRNLVENALKFSRGGTIHIDAGKSDTGIAVSVRDEGRGIEPDFLPRIFERHYQRYPSDPGTGIGLTLCKKIAELHNGSIRAESKGRGTGMKLIVSLPLL